jgi:hypothetical protein
VAATGEDLQGAAGDASGLEVVGRQEVRRDEVRLRRGGGDLRAVDDDRGQAFLVAESGFEKWDAAVLRLLGLDEVVNDLVGQQRQQFAEALLVYPRAGAVFGLDPVAERVALAELGDALAAFEPFADDRFGSQVELLERSDGVLAEVAYVGAVGSRDPHPRSGSNASTRKSSMSTVVRARPQR